jgi:hypothetical protein
MSLGADINPPNFQPIGLEEGAQASGSAIAGRYNQLGLGDSTMATQDESANLQKWMEQQDVMNNQNLQTAFQDQLAAANQGGSGFLSGLFTGGGGLGGLGSFGI